MVREFCGEPGGVWESNGEAGDGRESQKNIVLKDWCRNSFPSGLAGIYIARFVPWNVECLIYMFLPSPPPRDGKQEKKTNKSSTRPLPTRSLCWKSWLTSAWFSLTSPELNQWIGVKWFGFFRFAGFWNWYDSWKLPSLKLTQTHLKKISHPQRMA